MSLWLEFTGVSYARCPGHDPAGLPLRYWRIRGLVGTATSQHQIPVRCVHWERMNRLGRRRRCRPSLCRRADRYRSVRPINSTAVLGYEFLRPSVRFLAHTIKDHARLQLSTVKDQTPS